jgi:hypothetical protein
MALLTRYALPLPQPNFALSGTSQINRWSISIDLSGGEYKHYKGGKITLRDPASGPAGRSLISRKGGV